MTRHKGRHQQKIPGRSGKHSTPWGAHPQTLDVLSVNSGESGDPGESGDSGESDDSGESGDSGESSDSGESGESVWEYEICFSGVPSFSKI